MIIPSTVLNSVIIIHVQGKTEQEATEVEGKILTFGSYCLGVHGKGKSKVYIGE